MNDAGYQLICGDCLEVLKTLPAGSVDAVVTDPPAGIGFMGKEWDSFGSPRKSNGQQQRDAYRDGAPHRPGKHIQGGAGLTSADRDKFVAFLSAAMSEALRVIRPGGYALVWAIPRTSHWTATALEDAGWEIRDRIAHIFGQGFPKGKGCLKPAVEDWWLCRAPGKGVRPLGIDACRVEGIVPQVTQGVTRRAANGEAIYGAGHGVCRAPQQSNPHSAGRWPANLVLSHHPECNGECHAACPIRLLDEQSGKLHPPGTNGNGQTSLFGQGRRSEQVQSYSDSGGASRFFYVPKASRKNRGEGNSHPTVKSTALMEWLVKLVCPEGGTVLDPFMGSGTTGVACLQTGRKFIGIECEPTYFAIAQKRLAEATAGLLPGVLNG